MSSGYAKLLRAPMQEELWSPFRDAYGRRELALPRCRTCAGVFFYPRERCASCFSDDLDRIRVSGLGRLHSFTVVHGAERSASGLDIPYIYAIVRLDEGPKMPSDLVGCETDDIRIDMRVEVAFDEVWEAGMQVKFMPAERSASLW